MRLVADERKFDVDYDGFLFFKIGWFLWELYPVKGVDLNIAKMVKTNKRQMNSSADTFFWLPVTLMENISYHSSLQNQLEYNSKKSDKPSMMNDVSNRQAGGERGGKG